MQELKDLHGKLLAVIEQNQKKLINVVEEELLKVQLRIEEKRKFQATAEIVEEPGDGDEEAPDVHEVHPDTDADEDDIQEKDEHGEDESAHHIGGKGDDDLGGQEGRRGEGGEDQGENRKSRDEDWDKEEGGEQVEQGENEESGKEGEHIDSGDEGDKGDERRRSKRTIKPAIQSPWVLTKPTKRRKKPMEEKEIFFNTVSRMCSSKEGDK